MWSYSSNSIGNSWRVGFSVSLVQGIRRDSFSRQRCACNDLPLAATMLAVRTACGFSLSCGYISFCKLCFPIWRHVTLKALLPALLEGGAVCTMFVEAGVKF